MVQNQPVTLQLTHITGFLFFFLVYGVSLGVVCQIVETILHSYLMSAFEVSVLVLYGMLVSALGIICGGVYFYRFWTKGIRSFVSYMWIALCSSLLNVLLLLFILPELYSSLLWVPALSLGGGVVAGALTYFGMMLAELYLQQIKKAP